jgi:hypothetical protein
MAVIFTAGTIHYGLDRQPAHGSIEVEIVQGA